MSKSKIKMKACVYCGSILKPTIDHVIPRSKWRDYNIRRRILDNESNKVVACFTCNQSKGSMPPDQWFGLHPEYKNRLITNVKYLSNSVKEATGIM